ncbi:hypothetical protein DRN45_02385, partial [Thermococci archaeon]
MNLLDYPRNKIEIIVVDSNSNDQTVNIAKKYADRIIVRKSGRSEARNIGARISKGKYILFLDSDMILSESVIRECVNVLERDKTKVALY